MEAQAQWLLTEQRNPQLCRYNQLWRDRRRGRCVSLCTTHQLAICLSLKFAHHFPNAVLASWC